MRTKPLFTATILFGFSLLLNLLLPANPAHTTTTYDQTDLRGFEQLSIANLAGLNPSDWQTLPGPSGGSVSHILLAPDYQWDSPIFAAVQGHGVYVSHNEARDWQPTGSGDWIMVDLVMSPAFNADQTLFALTGTWQTGYTVWRTQDAGQSWLAMGSFTNGLSLVISPDFAHDQTLYLLTGSDNLTYRSTDGGDSFTPLDGWWAGHNVNVLSFSPDFAQDQTMFALAVSDGLYRSLDSGTTWTAAGLSGSFNALAVSPHYAQDEMLLVIDADGNLYLSHDGGDNWEPVIGVTLGSNGRFTLAFSPTFGTADQTVLIASSADPGPYRSVDGGATWEAAGWYDPTDPWRDGLLGGGVQALALTPVQDWSSKLFAATRTGVAVSANQGNGWTQSSRGLPRLAVRDLAHAPGQPQLWLAAGAYFEQTRFDSGTAVPDAGAIMRSADGGITWRQVSGRLPRLNAVAFSPNFAQDQTAFAAAGMVGQHGFVEGGLYRSTDGGRNWTAVSPTPTAFTALAIAPNYASSQTVWASGLDGLYRSTNGGASWSQISGVTAVELVVSPNYALDQTLFAATSNYGLQRSTDGGFIWDWVLAGPQVTALAVSPVYGASRTLYAAARPEATAPTTLYRSHNGGTSWQPLTGVIPPEQNGQPLTITSLEFAVDGSVVAGAKYGEETAVYRSQDGGSTWNLLPDVDATTLYDLTSQPSHSFSLYAATDAGLYSLYLPQGGPVGPGHWHSSGPRGGRANALAVSPNLAQDGLVLAGANWTNFQGAAWGLGVRKSTDYAQTWQESSTGMAGYSNVSGIFDYAFADDQTVFAATWGGLFRSDDAGDTWTLLPGAPQFGSQVKVAPDFNESGHMMLRVVYGFVLYLSHDGGATWTIPQIWPPDTATTSTANNVFDMVYSPDFANDQTIFITSQNGIWRSTDAGVNWTQLSIGYFSNMAISPDFAEDQTLWGGAELLFISEDGGETWFSGSIDNQLLDYTFIYDFAISPNYAQDQTLFAGTSKGLFWSENGGWDWTAVPEFHYQQIYNLVISPQWPNHPLLLLSRPDGVIRLHTADWPNYISEASQGLAPIVASVFARSVDESLLLVGSINHGIFSTSDKGQSWQPHGMQGNHNTRVVALTISPDYDNDATLFVGSNNTIGMGGSIHRSQDGGQTWEYLVSEQYVSDVVLSPDYAQDDTVLAAYGGKIGISTDRGTTWQLLPGWSYLQGSAIQILLLPTYPADGRLFVGGGRGFWWSEDHGASWTQAATGLVNGRTVRALQLSPNFAQDSTLLAVASWSEAGTYQRIIFRSTDGGVNWSQAMSGLPADASAQDVAFSPHFATNQTAYALTDRALYRSRDGGMNWSLVGQPPADVALHNLLVTSDGRVYVSSSAGVWRYRSLHQNLLINGGFEGTGGWSLPVTPAPASYSDLVAYNGQFALRLGIDNSNNVYSYSAARQTFTLPDVMLNATLTFHLYPASGEAVLAAPSALLEEGQWLKESPTAPGDAQYVLLLDPNTNAVIDVLHWDLSNAQAWQRHTFSLPLAYAGQSFVLHFGVFNDGINGRTALYVDDVSLIVLDGSLAPHQLSLPIIRN